MQRKGGGGVQHGGSRHATGTVSSDRLRGCRTRSLGLFRLDIPTARRMNRTTLKAKRKRGRSRNRDVGYYTALHAAQQQTRPAWTERTR